MTIEVLSRSASGTCSLTGKTDVEVWAVRAGGGEVQHISTQRLTEVFRILLGVGTSGSPPRTDPPAARSAGNS